MARTLFPSDRDFWPGHHQALPQQAAAKQKLPEVTLRTLQDGDYALLAKWMRSAEVYAFLEHDEAPSEADIKVAVLGRRMEPLIIVHDDVEVGFFALYFRGLVAHKTREFDIAIPPIEARRKGLAKAAIRALEAWAFDEKKLNGLWAKIFAENEASLQLVRACAWPRSEVQQGFVDMQDSLRDLVTTWMTPEIRKSLLRRRGF